MMGTKVKFRLDYDSKVFRSMLKSALYILLLPILVSIMLAASFIYSMEREAEGFREVVLDKIADEVNHEFRAAYQLINSVRNTELITSYAKSEDRDYWIEYQIFKFMNKVLIGTNLEMAYLYYPQHEFVFSDTGGVESEYFHEVNYEGSYEDWRNILKSRWNGKLVQLQGNDLRYRNVVISNLLNDRGEEACAVIAVQLSNEYVNRLIANLALEEGDRILIYNTNGIIGGNFDVVEQEALAGLLMDVGWKDDGETVRSGDVTYEVHARYSGQYGLTFVYASPKDIVHASFAFIRFYSAAVVVFCIVFSLMLCLAVTNRNYKPIKRLFGLFREPGSEGTAPDDYEKMEHCITECLYKNRNLLNTVKRYENDYREVYLEKVLYGRIRYLEGIEEGSRLYDLGLEAPWFVVVFYELAEAAEEDLLDIQPESGASLLKDALSAYMEEKMEYVSRFYLIEEYNGCVGVLNGDGPDLAGFLSRIEQDNVRILEEMEIQEGICCEGYVSGVPGGLAHLYEAYEQVMRSRKEAEDKEEEKERVDLGGTLRIDCVVAMVREQMSKPDLSVAGLADAFHVSPSHLSRFFKQQMGVGLLDYIHRCRINEAKELMKSEPSIRVKEVAERTGFYNVSAFIRVFKKIEDMTPGQYREKN